MNLMDPDKDRERGGGSQEKQFAPKRAMGKKGLRNTGV